MTTLDLGHISSKDLERLVRSGRSFTEAPPSTPRQERITEIRIVREGRTWFVSKEWEAREGLTKTTEQFTDIFAVMRHLRFFVNGVTRREGWSHEHATDQTKETKGSR